MYCEHCGTKLEQGYKFCTKCGLPMRAEKTPSHASVVIVDERWWHRLLKVAYILLFAITIGTGLIFSYVSMPYRTLNGALSSIACNNGKSYAPEKNSIYLYGDTLSSTNDEHARILCAHDTTNYYSYKYPAPSFKNYTFKPIYNEPDYGSWFFSSLFALFVTWSIVKLIRLGIQYIAFGYRPRWVEEFKKFY